MENNLYNQLSKRESQIMDIVFELNEVTANDIQERLPKAPSNSSVRNMLKTLETKGHLQHRIEKGQFYYSATIAPDEAKRSVLNHMLKIFFDNSIPRIVSTLISEKDLTPEELDEIEELIAKAREEDK